LACKTKQPLGFCNPQSAKGILMTEHSQLFTGAAQFYKYRAPYPAELFDKIRATFGLNGTGRLLDVGCGPGNVCLGLHKDFAEVVALDVNAEMLEQLRQNAADAGTTNLRWLQQPAEEIGPELGTFKLVTFGRSFHWMQREVVLQKAWDLLEPKSGSSSLELGGGIAIVDGSEQRSWWHSITEGIAKRWRVQERSVKHNADSPSERHEALVGRSRFTQIQQGRLTEMQTLTLDHLVGQVYSMSSTKPEVFGENLKRFDSELRAVLTLLEPSGMFSRERGFGYIFARKGG
jgi:SAM-dependent methyltransferase